MDTAHVALHSIYQTIAGTVIGSVIDIIFSPFDDKKRNDILLLEVLSQATLTAMILYNFAAKIEYRFEDPLSGALFFTTGFGVQENFQRRLKELSKRMKYSLVWLASGPNVNNETS